MKKRFFTKIAICVVMALAFCAGLLPAPPVFAAGEPEQSLVVQAKNLINTYYTAEFENVKDRTAGSVGEQNMAQNLANFMAGNGFSHYQNASYFQTFEIAAGANSQNVIGQKNVGAEHYVLLGAHYDSVYTAGKNYGYSDNLSGVVAALLTAQILQHQTRVNVILAFWGAEEKGCLGSSYFVKNLNADIKQKLLLYVNFDSVGAGDFCYYYTTNFSAKYRATVENFMKTQPIKKYNNQIFSPQQSNGINYSSIALNSDNSTFLKAGINSLSYFAGNLETLNGLGFFETVGHERIMHNTDNAEVVEAIFADDKFAKNIATFANATALLIDNQMFTLQNFIPNQINPILFSDVTLKVSGIILICCGFAVFLIVYITKFKQQKQPVQKAFYSNKKKLAKKAEKLKNK